MKQTKIENYNNQPDLKCGQALCEFVDLEHTIENLNESIKSLSNSFIEIGCYLKKIKDHSRFKDLGYESIYEFAEKNYNFSKTTTKNFISVYERFGDGCEDCPEIDGKYCDYNFSQLVELVSVKDDFENYSPSQTVKEIRISKLSNNIDSDKKAVEQWFENDLFNALKSNYKDCEVTLSGYIITLFYKGDSFYIKLYDNIIKTRSYSCNYKDCDCIFSFKLISNCVNRFIKLVDEDVESLKVKETKTTTVTTKVETTTSSPISDQIKESVDDYFEEELVDEVEIIDEENEYDKDEYDEDENFETAENGPTSDQSEKEEVVVEVVDHVQKLKNNAMREEFIRNPDNYKLLYDLKEVNARIFQHKEIPYIYEIKYFGKFYASDKEDWIHAEYHLLDPNSTKTFGYAMFHNTAQSLSIIVNHLKEIKY